MTIDSTLTDVRKTESYNDITMSAGNSIQLDTYLALRKEKERGRIWDSMVKSYDLNAKDVGSLLRTFENMIWHDEGYVVVDANFNTTIEVCP